MTWPREDVARKEQAEQIAGLRRDIQNLTNVTLEHKKESTEERKAADDHQDLAQKIQAQAEEMSELQDSVKQLASLEEQRSQHEESISELKQKVDEQEKEVIALQQEESISSATAALGDALLCELRDELQAHRSLNAQMLAERAALDLAREHAMLSSPSVTKESMQSTCQDDPPPLVALGWVRKSGSDSTGGTHPMPAGSHPPSITVPSATASSHLDSYNANSGQGWQRFVIPVTGESLAVPPLRLQP